MNMEISGRAPKFLKVLTPEQREAYARDGFISIPRLVDAAWIERLRTTMAEFVEHSRSLTESNVVFDLEPTHTPERSLF